MKIIHLFLPLLALISSCKKERSVHFELNYESSISIQANTPISLPFELLTPPVTTNSQSELEGRNSNLNLITAVALHELKIEIQSPPGKTFSFLKDVYIYISADGLDEKLIAQKTNIAANVGSVLVLDPSDENLKEYIKKQNYSIRLKATTDETVTQKIDINIYTVFAIDSGLNR